MERLIVNEGAGPVPRDLTAPLTRVGGSAACDLVLRDPSAAGSVFTIERTTHGHRARWVAGAVFHNEEALAAADLLHNDTLRVGDTLVLYKNPLATLPLAGAGPAVPRDELPPLTFDEVALVEELEELEVLDELEPLDESTPLARPSAPASAAPSMRDEGAATRAQPGTRVPAGAPPRGPGPRESEAAEGSAASGPPAASAPPADGAPNRRQQPPIRRGSTFLPPRHRGRPSR